MFGSFFWNPEKVEVEICEHEGDETKRGSDGDKDVEVEVVDLVGAVLVVGAEVDEVGGEC